MDGEIRAAVEACAEGIRARAEVDAYWGLALVVPRGRVPPGRVGRDSGWMR